MATYDGGGADGTGLVASLDAAFSWDPTIGDPGSGADAVSLISLSSADTGSGADTNAALAFTSGDTATGVDVNGGPNTLAYAEAWWSADQFDWTISQFLRDQSGNGHHLRLGSQWPAYVSEGALNLPGVSNNYATTPDAASIHITGDFDVVAHLSAPDWTPSGSTQNIANRWRGGVFGWSLMLQGGSGGKILFAHAKDASTWIQASSSVAPTVTDGADLWIRVTLDVDNGSGSSVVTFYTSSDGVTWTQLGTQVTDATTAGSLYSNSEPLNIGKNDSGLSTDFTGRIFYLAVYNGWGGGSAPSAPVGTPVAKFDPSAKADFTTSWAATTGETWTIVRPGARIDSLGGGLVVPGTTNAEAALTPNWAAITGDIDLRAYVALDDWTPSLANPLIVREGSTSQRAWRLYASSAGGLQLIYSLDGSTTTTVSSSTTHGFTDGSAHWVRVTRASSTGDIKFYTSSDGVSWTQLGTTQSSTSGALFASTSQVEIGGFALSGLWTSGKIYRAQVLSGIAGTTVFDCDFTLSPAYTSSITPTTGPTVTLQGQTGSDSADPLYLAYAGTRYAYLPGVSGNYLSIPDATNLHFTGDIDLRIDAAPDSYRPSNSWTYVAKDDSTGQISWRLDLRITDGYLRFSYSTDGTSTIDVLSSSPITAYADGTRIWVRVTRNATTGAVNFYTSTDYNATTLAGTWTAVGTTVSGSAGAMFSSTSSVAVGEIVRAPSASPFQGKIYRVQVFNGIAGTLVADIDTSVASPVVTTFAAATGQTVTINRSSSGRKTVVVDRNLFLLGTDDYMEAPDSLSGMLDFAAAQDYSVLLAMRSRGSAPAYQTYISKREQSTGNGWELATDSGTSNLRAVEDGTATAAISAYVVGPSLRDGVVHAATAVRSGTTFRSYQDGTISTTNDPTDGATSLTNNTPLAIGRRDPNYGGNYSDMEFIGAAIFRRALTTTEMNRVAAQFGALSDGLADGISLLAGESGSGADSGTTIAISAAETGSGSEGTSAVAFSSTDTAAGTDLGGGPNVLANGTFETNTTGWNAYYDAVLSRTTAQSHSGAASLKVDTSGVAGDGHPLHGALTGENASTFTGTAISTAQQVRVTGWVLAPLGVAYTLGSRPNGPAHQYWAESTATKGYTGTGAWQEVELTFGAPNSTTYGAWFPAFQVTVAGTLSTTLYLDDFTVDVLNPIAVSLGSGETGSGTDAWSTVQTSNADTGSGLDRAVTISESSADSSTALTDAVSLIGIGSSDNGGSVEDVFDVEPKSSDVALSVETNTLAVQVFSSDALAGIEGTPVAGFAATDTGSSFDRGWDLATTYGDTGAGSDAVIGIATGVTSADTLGLSDAATLAATVSAHEAASGTETSWGPNATITGSEVLAGVEGTTVGFASSDVLAGVDTTRPIGLTFSDFLTAGEGVLVGAAVASTDPLLGIDQQSLSNSHTDFGSGTDNYLVIGVAPSPESGHGADQNVLSILTPVAEHGPARSTRRAYGAEVRGRATETRRPTLNEGG